MIDGDEQPILGQIKFLGDERPSQFNRVFFEIIAKGKITQHFKEGVMARRIADIVEVIMLATGAHAFLRGGGAHIGAVLNAGEGVFKLHHARIGEHEGGIIARDQWR